MSATSTYRLQVRFAETDLMGVVHHASYLTYCEAARVDWLHKRGVSYDAWVSLGIHMAVVEAKLRYKSAAKFDQILAIDATMEQITRVTVRYRYRIRHEERLVCEAETLLACVGDSMKLQRIPANIAEIFRNAELPEADHVPSI